MAPGHMAPEQQMRPGGMMGRGGMMGGGGMGGAGGMGGMMNGMMRGMTGGGSRTPAYDAVTINGKRYPGTDPLEVRRGDRVRVHRRSPPTARPEAFASPSRVT